MSAGIWVGGVCKEMEIPNYLCPGCKTVLRYSKLRKETANITDAVLAADLKEWIDQRIVARKSYDEIPPRVEYSLPETGISVVPILLPRLQMVDSAGKQCAGIYLTPLAGDGYVCPLRLKTDRTRCLSFGFSSVIIIVIVDRTINRKQSISGNQQKGV